MTEKEQIELKLDVFKHRAFLWLIEDIRKYEGVECGGIEYTLELLKRRYKIRLKELEPKSKFTQKELGL